MRARFGSRRRRRAADDGKPVIDAEQWFRKIVGDERLDVAAVEPLETPGVPGSFAVTGRGTDAQGAPLLLGFSPVAGGDALLAVLAAAASESGFTGTALAVSPVWSAACRRRLSVVANTEFTLACREASWLGPDAGRVQAEPPPPALWLSPSRVGASLESEANRQLFLRALAALEGLASKHGGALSGYAGNVELILMARRVASLRVGGDEVILETLTPKRSGGSLSGDRFADAFDSLEGSLRKHLNDRKVRDGEDGMRARVAGLLIDAGAIADARLWPVGGSDKAVLDILGADDTGRPVVGAARASLDLSETAAVLDATLALRGSIAAILGGARGRVADDMPRLVLGAQEVGAGVQRVLCSLALPHQLFEVRSRRGRGFELSALSGEEAQAPRERKAEAEPPRLSRAAGRSAERAPERTRERRTEPDAASGVGAEASSESSSEAESGPGRGRRRRRGGRGRRGGSREDGRDESRAREGSDETANDATSRGSNERAPAAFEEVSLFDLEEDSSSSGSNRRGGRSRRRGRRQEGDSAEGRGDQAASSGGEAGGGRESRGSESRSGRDRVARGTERTHEESPPDDEDVDVDELLADLPEGVLETEAVSEPAYDDSEDSDSEPVAQNPVEVVSSQSASGPQPRRRVAIVAHADRDSLLAAILLARDIRLVVGIWVYPQAELMTFFRGVVTDLKEETPIFMVGFTPSPAREVLQAVSLCSDRVTWLDHHVWPPEDLEAVKQAIGEDRVHLNPRAGSSLPGVLAGATRRSRFSDKLVDLATGRFTQHDYERWGRLWWSRLGEIAGKSGDRRADVDALLVGRPSDLAKEAERIAVPAAPDEIAYVSSRDFRLVHFAGYILVVVEVGDDLSPHLAARIARERYAAPLSLTRHHDSEVLVLAADEPAGRRSLDVGTVVGQLGDKVDWVEPLADNDHLARFRIRDLAQHPDRLEEVIGMIAMARSFLER